MRFPGHAGGSECVGVVGIDFGVELQMFDMPAIGDDRSRQKLVQCADVLRAELAIALDILNGGEEHEHDLLFPLQFDRTVASSASTLALVANGPVLGAAALVLAEPALEVVPEAVGLPSRKIKITESEDDPCDPPREGEFAEGGICHLPLLLLSKAYRSAFGERHELEESANGIRTARRPMLFSFAAREWIDANKARWSNANISIQELSVKHLSGYFASMLLIDLTPEDIGKYQGLRQKQKASNRTINMEVSTLHMILQASRLWSALADDVKMLPERKDVGRALTADEEKRLLEACKKSPRACTLPLWPSVIPD